MKKRLRFAICDDLPEDRARMVQSICNYLDIHGHVADMDEYVSGEELLASDVSVYDLIILDIFMDELNGIETAKKLIGRNSAAQIIFCSTSNEFAAESYDVSALRYLTKPVSEEKLFHTLDIFFHAHMSLRTLTYKQNRMDESIYVSDIVWIEAGDHKSIIHTRNGDIITTTVMKQLAEQLEGMDFIKPIRYALVPLSEVNQIPNDELVLRDGTRIPISRNQREEIKKMFSRYKMKMLLRKMN